MQTVVFEFSFFVVLSLSLSLSFSLSLYLSHFEIAANLPGNENKYISVKKLQGIICTPNSGIKNVLTLGGKKIANKLSFG